MDCRCDVCLRTRAEPLESWRTQSSLAVTADDRRWLLIEASPDLPAQLRREPRLWPRDEARDASRRASPIAAVVLTDGDVDHVAGLLSLREAHAFGLYGARSLLAMLDRCPLMRVLGEPVARRALPLDERVAICDGRGEPIGVWLRAFAVPSKVPLWAERDVAGELACDARSEHVVGLELGASDTSSCFVVPGCARIDDELAAELRGAALVLFDGTVYRDGELARAGVGHKTGRRMGHLAIDGEDGSLARFASLDVARKVFLHVNNTNPILVAESAERARVEAAGWEVAFDTMELVLT